MPRGSASTTEAVRLIDDPRQIQALAQPVRIRVLDALRTPDSAAGVARTIGGSRQNVNYHVKELERVGLVRHAGERRKGNFIEQLYQSAARRYVVSPRFAWDPDRLASTLRDQVSLSHLANLGERLQQDATALIDRAAFEGEEIATATVEAEVRFKDEAARSAFMQDYVAALRPLLKKHGGRSGTHYRVALAVYPGQEPELEEE